MNCQHCGATLSLDDMTRPNCPYCKAVLPHHARAAEHAALVNKVLHQQISAQYPGTPPQHIPQIGYGHGAPLQNFHQFQQHQMQQGMQRAGGIVAMAIIVPIVLAVVVMIVGAGVAFFLVSRGP
jgi:hypothetical protein